MRYLDYLNQNRENIVGHLELILNEYKVQPVGSGYIDCIVMKYNFKDFIKEVTRLGVVINISSWWCYVNSSHPITPECPHGMGGPISEYYEGWFSELQNDFYDVGEEIVDKLLESYDSQLVYSINMKVINDINDLLKIPFRYTPNDYIEGNKCVMTGLWLLVPDDWKRGS